MVEFFRDRIQLSMHFLNDFFVHQLLEDGGHRGAAFFQIRSGDHEGHGGGGHSESIGPAVESLRKFGPNLAHRETIDNEGNKILWMVLVAGFDVAHESHGEAFVLR